MRDTAGLFVFLVPCSKGSQQSYSLPTWPAGLEAGAKELKRAFFFSQCIRLLISAMIIVVIKTCNVLFSLSLTLLALR